MIDLGWSVMRLLADWAGSGEHTPYFADLEFEANRQRS
jgi:hypothetical protein